MKRLFSIMICIIILGSCSMCAFASEEFTLRNGIEFGDTIDVIVTKETTLTREGDDSNWFTGKIAGYSKARCGFILDDDGKMTDMTYSFGPEVCLVRDTMNDAYKTLYESLTRKYGKAIGNTGGTTYIITGNAIERMVIYVYLLGQLDGYSADYTDYDEWIVDCDGYHVKIDLISYYVRDDTYKYDYYVDVSYHYYTDEDVDEAVNAKREERQEVDDDL